MGHICVYISLGCCDETGVNAGDTPYVRIGGSKLYKIK